MAFLRLGLRWIRNDYLTSLLQFGVLGFGLLQDGDVGVGVFPETQKILIGSPRFRFVARTTFEGKFMVCVQENFFPGTWCADPIRARNHLRILDVDHLLSTCF
jgi:hypothetical protein